MLYSIKSDRPSFKTVEFKSGCNIIIAERKKEATKKDSRNGLGKSTLIEIIHFCLGAKKGETLSKPQMNDWTFILEMDLIGNIYSISRNTSNQGKIIIKGDCSNWPIKPDIDENTGKQIISLRDWNKVLGIILYGLQPSYNDFKYTPTFRSLISYFIRRNGQRGAFLNPFQQHKAQKEWDIQVNNAFLLGLGWEYASKWQLLKDRIKVLDQIKEEAKSGILTNLIGSVGELEAKRIRLEAQVIKEEENLSNFRVHPQYSQIEKDANDLTNKIHDLVNKNVCDKRLLENYEESLHGETDADPDLVTSIYQEAGLILPVSITKRMEDVMSFHNQIVKNRKDFLAYEIDRIKTEIAKKEQQIQDLSGTRMELMQVLQKHGALEEYTQFQTNHQKSVAELKDIVIRIENLKKFEQGKSAIKIEQELLLQQANTEIKERESQLKDVTLRFNSNSEALYEVPGTLSIDIKETGFKFNVKIERSGSHGIGNMKIFCYDLMLAQIWSRRAKTPVSLIHDSIIFDGVDERQKALAIELAAKEAEKLGFQYICTINSDAIPTRDFSPDFKFEQYVRATLTDAMEEGGLLGIRF